VKQERAAISCNKDRKKCSRQIEKPTARANNFLEHAITMQLPCRAYTTILSNH